MPSCRGCWSRANPKILPDAPGYIDCSVYITPLEVPTRIDRALVTTPPGNHHFNLDPVLGKAIARAIADGLSRNYPCTQRPSSRISRCTSPRSMRPSPGGSARAVPLRGVKLVSYHPDMIYFAERYG